MKNLYLIIIVFSFLYISCNSSDFEKNGDGLYYKILTENEEGAKPRIGDFVELNVRYADSNDSLLFDSKEIAGAFKIELKTKNRNKLSIESAVTMLKVGERALFKIPADSFYLNNKKVEIPLNIKKSSLLTFDISLIKILDKKEVELEKENFIKERKKAEDNVFLQFIKENHENAKANISGLYVIIKKQGSGKYAKLGDKLLVNYTGKFLNGEIFDSSYDRNEPIEFILGKLQVIPAWEEGFFDMKEGTKAKFIIPSQLAYGEKGYGKIIPPFSSLIFEVELVSISKKMKKNENLFK